MATIESKGWVRGYFCAVAMLIKKDGCVNTQASELFREGGDWKQADPEDIQTFKEHGLIPR